MPSVNKAVSYSCHVYFETNTKYYVLILLVVQVILGVKTRMQEWQLPSVWKYYKCISQALLVIPIPIFAFLYGLSIPESPIFLNQVLCDDDV